VANQRALGIAGPNPVQIRSYPVKSGATFIQGDFVILTSTGLDSAAAAGNNFANPTSNAVRIVGRAIDPALVQDGSGAQATYAAVEMAAPGVWFQIPLYSATPASAVPTITQIGTKYGGRQVTAGFPSVNLDDTSNVIFMVTDFDPNDFTAWPGSVGPGTTQYANVYAEVLAAASLATGAR